MITDIIGYVMNLLSFKGMTYVQRKNMIVSDFENGNIDICDAIDLLQELSL